MREVPQLAPDVRVRIKNADYVPQYNNGLGTIVDYDKYNRRWKVQMDMDKRVLGFKESELH